MSIQSQCHAKYTQIMMLASDPLIYYLVETQLIKLKAARLWANNNYNVFIANCYDLLILDLDIIILTKKSINRNI